MGTLKERGELELDIPTWLKRKRKSDSLSIEDLENEVLNSINIWDKRNVQYDEVPVENLVDWDRLQKRFGLDRTTVAKLQDYAREVVKDRKEMGFIHVESVKGIMRRIIMEDIRLTEVFGLSKQEKEKKEYDQVVQKFVSVLQDPKVWDVDMNTKTAQLKALIPKLKENDYALMKELLKAGGNDYTKAAKALLQKFDNEGKQNEIKQFSTVLAQNLMYNKNWNEDENKKKEIVKALIPKLQANDYALTKELLKASNRDMNKAEELLLGKLKEILNMKTESRDVRSVVREHIMNLLNEEGGIEVGKYYKPDMSFLTKKLPPQQLRIIKQMLRRSGENKLLVTSTDGKYAEVAGNEMDKFLGTTRVPVEGLIAESKQLNEEESNKMECGFDIFTIQEDMLTENWEELMDERKDDPELQALYDKYANKEGDISYEGWDRLNEDFITFERNMMKYLEKEYGITMRDEGHNGDSLIGTCWLDRSNKNAYDFVMEHHHRHGDGAVNDFVTSLPTWDFLSQGMSDIGQRFVDGGVWFFEIDEDEYEAWEDAQ